MGKGTERDSAGIDQDRATCYHEAAHAVFARQQRDRMVLLYVDADEMYCAARSRHPYDWVDHLRDAMYTLSGRFAELLDAWGETSPDTWEEYLDEVDVEAFEEKVFGEERYRGDASALMACLHGMAGAPGGGDLEARYLAVVSVTEEQVHELWPQITAVAQALRKRRRLTGDEVARIIEMEAADE